MNEGTKQKKNEKRVYARWTDSEGNITRYKIHKLAQM